MERTHKGIQQHLRSFFPISLGPLPAVYIGPYIYGVACLLGSSSSRVRYSPDEVSSFLLYNIPYRCLGVAGYLSLSLSRSVFLVFLPGRPVGTYCFGPPGFRTKQLPEPAQLVASPLHVRTCVACLVGSHLNTATAYIYIHHLSLKRWIEFH